MTVKEGLEKMMGIWYDHDNIVKCPEDECPERGKYSDCYSESVDCYCPVEQKQYVLSDN